MRVCLVSAPIAAEFQERDEIDSCLEESAVSDPQMGILTLAAVLEARGDEVRIVDLDQAYLAYLSSSSHRKRSFADISAERIAAIPADVYGFSSLCGSYPLTIRIAQALKRLRLETPILLGGPQATVVDRETLAAFPFIDLILRGEAEVTLPVLLDELAGEQQFQRVPSLSYRGSTGPCRNPNASILEDLDSIPMPAYHLTGGLHGAKRASLELGRGCPFACTFCSTNDFFRRKFRLRSPGRVLRDMREIASRYEIRQFQLVHDMFTVDRKRVVAFCEAMLASGEGFQWACSARTDCVDLELLNLMASAGCTGIFYGVEAGSPRMQKIIDKDLGIEEAKRLIAATEQAQLSSTVSLITGFPEETESDLRQTLHMFAYSAQHPLSSPQLNILAPLAGTPIHVLYRDQLTLGDLCSEMSHQGARQDEDDRKLIEKHPDVFPNFYLLPTPHLDRECLLELREFTSNGIGHFRWLLCAINHAGLELYDLFLEWRRHRMQVRPIRTGPELRRYYESIGFRKDFLSFVPVLSAAQDQKVRALLEFELAWSFAANTSAQEAFSREDETPVTTTVRSTDFLSRTAGTRLIELSCDIQSVIESIKHRTEVNWRTGSYFYVTLERKNALKRLYAISCELGRLLQLCDGRHTAREIGTQLAAECSNRKGSQGKKAVSGLIQAACREGLLRVSSSPPGWCIDHTAALAGTSSSPTSQ